jgi:hypothetical protein
VLKSLLVHVGHQDDLAVFDVLHRTRNDAHDSIELVEVETYRASVLQVVSIREPYTE